MRKVEVQQRSQRNPIVYVLVTPVKYHVLMRPSNGCNIIHAGNFFTRSPKLISFFKAQVLTAVGPARVLHEYLWQFRSPNTIVDI
jgi:hypothetical protein